MCGFSRRISQSGKSPLPPSNLKNLFLYSIFRKHSLMTLGRTLDKTTDFLQFDKSVNFSSFQ
jgi:hypothetical protein